MARSLTITHEEEARTTPLFTVFIIIAMGWLILSALAGSSAPSVAATPAPDVPVIDG